jgi:hypothetical protein
MSVSFFTSSGTVQSGKFVTILLPKDADMVDCRSAIVPPCSLKHSLSEHIAFGVRWYEMSSPTLQDEPHILQPPSYFAFITVPMEDLL